MLHMCGSRVCVPRARAHAHHCVASTYLCMYIFVCIYGIIRIHISNVLGLCGSLVLQCVAECCSVMQCVAVCLDCVAACCNVLGLSRCLVCVACVAVCLTCVAVCCSVLQCVAVCCSVLQCVADTTHSHEMRRAHHCLVLQRAAYTTRCCSMPQPVAVCCRYDATHSHGIHLGHQRVAVCCIRNAVLQWVAACCSVLLTQSGVAIDWV